MASAEASKNSKKVQVRRYKPEEDPKEHYLNTDTGIWNWLTTVDHKKIGLLYLMALSVFFLAGGLLALGIRIELWDPAANVYPGRHLQPALHAARRDHDFPLPGPRRTGHPGQLHPAHPRGGEGRGLPQD
ncbi:MAG: hypothetical protein U5K31_04680 [Balneolaceae bacterium]|nr:hypothetical protein [Balneolaceae bacterium]